MGRPRILAINAYYLPGYKGGGSIQALANLIGHLQEEFEFVVVTSAHDLKEKESYSAREQAETMASEGYEIRYFGSVWALIKGLRRLLAEPWDLIYLNSAFSPGYSILPLLLRRLMKKRGVPVVMAPRGEFMIGNLQSNRLKLLKKKLFLTIAKALGHFNRLEFHATSPEDAEGISSMGFASARISCVPDLPPKVLGNLGEWVVKTAGRLRVLFVSRIVPGKNLGFALEVLRGVHASVDFDIVGPIGDEGYWNTCKQLAAKMPGNVRVKYLGAVPHAEILGVFVCHDLFFLPTQAENNGYVVLESLVAGCPVLLSDRTPWRGLRALGVGQELPLGEPDAFRTFIEELAALTPEAHLVMRERAQVFGRERLLASEDATATHMMFLEVLRLKSTS